ncbi:MAG: hypothetical protein ACREDL_13240 [Bradyrhizobium sp.]
MSALFPCCHSAASPPSAPVFLGGATFDIASLGLFKLMRRDFVGRRGRARFRKEGRAIRGGVQEPTDRGPDKRPQGAALSVGCFCLGFFLIPQCAAPTRNVRAPFNTLLGLYFSHIAEAGYG